MVKKDHQSWFYMRGSNNSILTKHCFVATGREGHVYRIGINRIGENLKLLSLYFYDGFVESGGFYATATLYFLTFRESDLGDFKLTRGPAIFLEHETLNRYRKRDYKIKLEDLDRNGIKEVVVHYGHIKRIFQYVHGQGMKNIAKSSHRSASTCRVQGLP